MELAFSSKRSILTLKKIFNTTDQEADHKQTPGELVHEIIGRIQPNCDTMLDPAWIVTSFNRQEFCLAVQLAEPLAEITELDGRLEFNATETGVFYQLTNVEGIDLFSKKYRVISPIYWGTIHVPITCELSDGELKAFVADKLNKVGLIMKEFRNNNLDALQIVEHYKRTEAL
ncbi:MAG: hypothetical protein SGPRY_012489 [Prymnesium sp.]